MKFRGEVANAYIASVSQLVPANCGALFRFLADQIGTLTILTSMKGTSFISQIVYLMSTSAKLRTWHVVANDVQAFAESATSPADFFTVFHGLLDALLHSASL